MYFMKWEFISFMWKTTANESTFTKGAGDVHPTLGPISFIFMQFLGKYFPIYFILLVKKGQQVIGFFYILNLTFCVPLFRQKFEKINSFRRTVVYKGHELLWCQKQEYVFISGKLE